MALIIVCSLLALGLVLAVVAPFRALVVTVFLAPWSGLDVDVGLRVTAYLIFLVPLAGVFLLAVFSSKRAMEALRSVGFLWLVIVYAVLWSLIQIPFLPEASVRGGILRSSELRALVQIAMFLITISPVFIVPWLLRSVDQVQYLMRTYLVSAIVLAGLGWVQLLIWIITGTDPMPVGFVDNLLGGEAGQRSGQFTFGGDMIYRMSSLGGEPKGLGAGLAVGLLLIQAGIRPRGRWAGAVWPFLFVSMLATFSTMAILAWFGASLVQLAFGGRGSWARSDSKLVFNRRYLYLGVFLLVLVPGTFIAFPESSVVRLIESRTIERVMGESGGPGGGSAFLEDFNKAVSEFLRASPGYLLTGVGLGNVHLYADRFLPDYAVRYAGGTPFVAKSYLLRWVSELGILSLAVFLFWWIRLLGHTTRMTRYRAGTVALGAVVQRAGWGLLAFWLVSGYVTPQFFLLTGIMLGVSQLLRMGYREERSSLSPHEARPEAQ